MKEEPRKHRYVYFLSSKKEKKIYLNSLKHPQLDYPKLDALVQPEVRKIEVENEKNII